MNDIDEVDKFHETVKVLLFKGQKIPAVKKYREETGLGLKEAKDAVDAIERELREEHPDQFIEHRVGVTTKMLLGIIVIWILWALWNYFVS